ncbi:PLP-dependent aminotransferase family protein [Nonomuraea sp. NBC_01738]|uniref:aminotransferase-like domain-containing protein n=1 Tax=Nonomuraea sp. NBC_01738 TaxID=2976003 RepID=UPI002E114EC5|nr:PLP-dependent aminotransferase family protein [Nonomuraea sp. NBC_01738]
MRNPRRLSIPIRLERDPARALQDQLADQLRAAIDGGRMAAGTRIPSTRTMAGILGVSRGVVVSAYETLFAQGYVTGRSGSGTYVAGDRTPAPLPSLRHAPAPASREAQAPISMHPDRPSARNFPLAAWRAAWRHASHDAPPVEELHPAGLPALRAAVAEHLRETRGLVLDEHEVIITAGFSQALQLVVLGLGKAGAGVALENPAPLTIRTALAGLARVLPVPVDARGARPDQIPRNADVFLTMPERNDPLGARMSPDRRHAVAGWAARHGGLVLEPGFDGLFNAGVGPLPSIMALGEARNTAMIGTFNGILTPTLRLAYLVVPRGLAHAIQTRIAVGREQPSYLCQRAMADLLTSGCVTRRADLLTRLYAAKRMLVRHALEPLPGLRLLGAATGSAVTMLLPDRVRAADFQRTLRGRGLLVTDLARYHHPDAPSRNGLVLGYGHLDEMTLRRALRLLTGALRDHGLARRAA